MRPSLLVFVVASGVLVACSGGTGTPGSTYVSPHESSGASPQDPSGARREGARSGTDSAACPPCNASYICTGSIQGKPARFPQLIVSDSASCPTPTRGQGPSKSDGALVLGCGGAIHSAPLSSPYTGTVGSWRDVGGGAIVECFGVLGTENCVTCLPGTERVDNPRGRN